jgi:multidrug efflux system membrane fusion protein
MNLWKITVGTLVVAGAIIGGRIYWSGHGVEVAGAAQGPAPMAMPVPVARAMKQTLPVFLDYSARMESIRNISLQARVSGYLAEQVAPDGADVTEGDLLYRIDPRDLQAALDQARAQAQRDAASVDYAKGNFSRGNELSKSGFVAKDTIDQRESALRQAQASLTSDQAAIRIAELNLSYAEIRAPFSGRLGRNQAPVGTLISVAGAPLNTLVQLDPIYVTFTPSEGELAEIETARARGKVDVDVLLPGETEARHHGELTFLDNVVDKGTGTITARATVANSDLTLLPGQYVRVRLHVSDTLDALMIPQTAVGSSQLGKYVYLVGDGKRVDQRIVTLGRTQGDLVHVEKGVTEADKIIVGNLQKIFPGAPVEPSPPAKDKP